MELVFFENEDDAIKFATLCLVHVHKLNVHAACLFQLAGH
jgi:hypothetical protein